MFLDVKACFKFPHSSTWQNLPFFVQAHINRLTIREKKTPKQQVFLNYISQPFIIKHQLEQLITFNLWQHMCHYVLMFDLIIKSQQILCDFKMVLQIKTQFQCQPKTINIDICTVIGKRSFTLYCANFNVPILHFSVRCDRLAPSVSNFIVLHRTKPQRSLKY